MDSGLAVVIGAVVAFLGSIVGSVLAPRWAAERTRKLEDQRARRENIAAAILEITTALAELLRARSEHQPADSTTANILTAKLALNLDQDDAEMELLTVNTIALITQREPSIGATAISVFQTVSHQWFRGQISGNRIIETAEAEFKVAHPTPTRPESTRSPIAPEPV